MPLENWRPVVGFPGYAVSDQGRILGKRGLVRRLERLPDGYLRVGFFVGGKRRNTHRLVHCVVAEAWIGPRPSGYQVNHKDGNKGNNALSNLEYVTPRQNIHHAYRELNVRRARGSENGWAKLTDDDVRTMRRRYLREGASLQELAVEFGIHPTTVHRVATGRTWKHITEEACMA